MRFRKKSIQLFYEFLKYDGYCSDLMNKSGGENKMGQEFIKAFMGMNGPSISDQLYGDKNLGKLEKSINSDYRLFKVPYDFRQRGPEIKKEDYEAIMKKYPSLKEQYPSLKDLDNFLNNLFLKKSKESDKKSEK